MAGLLSVLLLAASLAAMSAGDGAEGDNGGAAGGVQGCPCPRGGDQLPGWLKCIGLDAAERARISDEGWAVEDLRRCRWRMP